MSLFCAAVTVAGDFFANEVRPDCRGYGNRVRQIHKMDTARIQIELQQTRGRALQKFPRGGAVRQVSQLVAVEPDAAGTEVEARDGYGDSAAQHQRVSLCVDKDVELRNRRRVAGAEAGRTHGPDMFDMGHDFPIGQNSQRDIGCRTEDDQLHLIGIFFDL